MILIIEVYKYIISNIDLVGVTHHHLKLTVNFEKNTLKGHVILDAERKNKTADSLVNIFYLLLSLLFRCIPLISILFIWIFMNIFKTDFGCSKHHIVKYNK